MIIGIPREIKGYEYRVGATPSIVAALVQEKNRVIVESYAGASAGFSNQSYKEAGAEIVDSPKEVYASDLIVKVKEPQESELDLLKEGQILFCYLHLSPNPSLARQLLLKKIVGIAYETVTGEGGTLPLLIPMSEIAGRVSIQVGAFYLQLNNGGRGVLLGGVPGVLPASVLVIGGGVAGMEAARMAIGLGAHVVVLDKNLERLRELDSRFGPSLKTLHSTESSIKEAIKSADLVVGAVLVPGKTSPKLISRDMLRLMAPGSVIVDVAIDQGGCTEASRPTTHGNPTFLEEGIVHYCVTNMPSACAKTSTIALTNATVDYVLEIARKGYKKAFAENPGLKNGLNVCLGKITHPQIAADLSRPQIGGRCYS